MLNELKQQYEVKMQKAVQSLHHEMGKIRTGRAQASLLDHVMVDYYGQETLLNQVANVSAGDARTLLVTPWEKTWCQPLRKRF